MSRSAATPLPSTAKIAKALQAVAEAQRAQAEALEAVAEAFLTREDQEPAQGAAPRTGALLTVREVMEQLGMSKAWVYRAIQEGLLPFVQLGNQRRVHPDDLKAFIQARRICDDATALAREARRGPSLSSVNGYHGRCQASEE